MKLSIKLKLGLQERNGKSILLNNWAKYYFQIMSPQRNNEDDLCLIVHFCQYFKMLKCKKKVYFQENGPTSSQTFKIQSKVSIHILF